MKNQTPIVCLRNTSAPLPNLLDLAPKADWEKPTRIRCRKIDNLITLSNKDKQKPTKQDILNSSDPTGPPAFYSQLLRNERKLERAFRSKSALDAIFELAPQSPWRQTTYLKFNKPNLKVIQLDFKNFYPSILCSCLFPHPGKLEINSWEKNKDTSIENSRIAKLCQNPGLVHCILYPKDPINQKEFQKRANQNWRQIHPFQIQEGKKSSTFEIQNRPIETLIHTAEIPVWTPYFTIEPKTTILSKTAIPHPLAPRVIKWLKELEDIRKNKSGDFVNSSKNESTLKLLLNASASTPKLRTPKDKPSPYGVHCLSSQIICLARAWLFQTIHACLMIDNKTEILQVNTDGFILACPNPEKLLKKLSTLGIAGNKPGQLRIKAQGDEALILGPNVWWIINNKNKNNKIVGYCGVGKLEEVKDRAQLLPTKYHYVDNGIRKSIPIIHLADFHHQLNHQTLKRAKPKEPPISKRSERGTSEHPWQTTFYEKQKSLKTTLSVYQAFRKKLLCKS